MGTETMIDAADRSAHCVWNCCWKRWMPSGQVEQRLAATDEHARREVLAPRGQEVEQEHDGEGGQESGSRTLRNAWNSEQPSIRAASSRSTGTVS